MNVTKIKGLRRQLGKAAGSGSGDPDIQFTSDKIVLVPRSGGSRSQRLGLPR